MGDLKRVKFVSKRKELKALSERIAALEMSLEGFAGSELMQGLMDGLRIRVERLEEGGLRWRALSGQVEILRSAEAALRTELRAELGKAPRPAPERQKRRPSPPSGDGQQSRDQRGRIALRPWEKAGIGRHTWYRRRRLEREAAAQALVAASDERAKPLLMQEESDGESDP